MTKVIIICDTHIGVRNASPVFHEYFKKSFKWFFDYIDENEIGTVIHLGDLFDRRKHVDFLSANLARKEFLTPLDERGVATYIIAGNHDIYWRNDHTVNSLDEIVKGKYQNILTFTEPELVDIDGVEIQLMPWICQSNSKQSYDTIKTTSSKILMGHFEITGFQLFKGVVSNHGDDRSIFKDFDLVFSGHYHSKSSQGNIHYLGAFTEHTWADYDDPRGFTVFDTETKKFEFIRNPHRIFKMIDYDDVKEPDMLKHIQSTDYSEYANCYVKVLCSNRTNPYAFDLLLDKLYAVSPVDISIVEDISAIIDSDDEVVDQAQDTPTLLNKYIDGLTLNIDNDKMKSYMKNIYVEALEREHVEQ